MIQIIKEMTFNGAGRKREREGGEEKGWVERWCQNKIGKQTKCI